MTNWTKAIIRALDSRAQPVDVFVRDDDAGWADHRLLPLLDLHASAGVPIDLAVIPGCMTPPLASALIARIDAGEAIGLHQHGYSHANHEPTGRKCEFGRSRGFDEQLADIRKGWTGLRTAFGPRVDPIFTPPWNRCVVDTGQALMACEFEAISQDRSACRMGIPGLVECPIQVDWFARRRSGDGSLAEWTTELARALRGASAPLGMMLHHALMDDAEHRLWADILEVLGNHAAVRILPMRAVVRSLARGGRES